MTKTSFLDSSTDAKDAFQAGESHPRGSIMVQLLAPVMIEEVDIGGG